MNSRLICGTRFDVLGSGYAIAPTPVSCRKNFGRACGSALISTLLMIVVLTIIVTAFMQSMAVERRTASSYKNKLQAELAAEAGAAAAIRLVVDLFSTYPDSATGWSTFSGGNTEATVFFYRAIAGSNTPALPGEANPQILARPLVSGSLQTMLASGAAATQLSALTEASSFAEALSTTNSINFNQNGRVTGTFGNNAQRFFRARWIDILKDPSQAENLTTNPVTGLPTNPPVARYAFWVDDTSFRVNVNTAGSDPRGANSPGASTSEISMQGVLSAVNATVSASAVESLRDTLADDRLAFPSQINHATDSSGADFDLLKFYITDKSGALNLSRAGVRRVNLNKVVKDIPIDGSAAPVPIPDAQEAGYTTGVRRQLDRIIAAICNPFGIVSGAGADMRPAFGQRFYNYQLTPAGLNASTTTDQHARLYFQRIAANIRDYIDADSYPTVVLNDSATTALFPVKPPARPVTAIGFNVVGNNTGDNETAAIGKEALPGLNEYAFRASLYSMNPPARSGGSPLESDYDVAIDHYLEFLNLWNQSIPLTALSPAGDGSDVFIKIYNQFSWDTAGGDDIPPGRPFEIALSEFVDGNGNGFVEFPAGGITVFSTDDNPSARLTNNNQAQVFRPTPAALARLETEEARRYRGKTRRVSGNNFRINPRLGTNEGRGGSSGSDYDTHMILGNDLAIFESFTALPIPINMSINNEGSNRLAPNESFFFRGGSLFGSTGAISQKGDPRSLNEQLRFQRYRSPSDNDQTRFFHSGLNNNAVPASSTLTLPNTNYTRMETWPDFSPDPISSAANAASTIANTEMQSIGELGNIYDPSRMLRSGNVTGASFARGGGLTFRVGQSDRFAAFPVSARSNQWDGKPLSQSRNRAAWRLTDIFSTRDFTGPEEVVMPGVININGVNRDGGAAFRALIYQLALQGVPEADPSLAGRQVEADALVQAINTRLNANNPDPFWERGELSEVALFNSGSQLAGSDMAKVVDRGREELVRRVIELITTKGNVFTVYCAGESLMVSSNGNRRVLASSLQKITFEITPVYDTPLPDDDAFIPSFNTFGVAQAASTPSQERFRQPDDFIFTILSTQSL